MPKIFLSETEKMNDRLATWVYGQMRVKRISQRELAEELHITQQGLSYKLKHRQISYGDFITFVNVFEPNHDELAWLIGRRGK